MALPTLTPEQAKAGLAAAKLARSERAAALDDLEKGAVTLADFLASQDEVIKRTRVRVALMRLNGVGGITADKMLAAAGVPAERVRTRRISQIGPHQRQSLVEQAEKYAA